MSFSALLQAIKTLLGDAFKHRNDPSKWEGWIEVHGNDDAPKTFPLNQKFKSVSIELSGIKFVFDLGGDEVVLEAKPDLHNYRVYIQHELDPEARLANPTLKPTPGHPLRVALDFRPVTFNGEECRFNLRFVA